MSLSASAEEGIYNHMDVFHDDADELRSAADELLLHAQGMLERVMELYYDSDVAQAITRIDEIREEL